MKPDFAHRETDKLLEDLERALRDAYAEATEAAGKKLADYVRRFEAKDEKWKLWVAQGKKTEAEYKKWRTSQIMFQNRWENLQRELAMDMVRADEIAQQIIKGELSEIYALNHNFATYEIEKALGMSTNYTLYSQDTVRQLLKKNPKLLPNPTPGSKTARLLAENKDLRWNMQRIQSVMLQGILQGQSIPELAKTIEKVTDGNIKNAIRNARTMATGAQNAGRRDAYIRAEKKGVKLRQTWVATLDQRTRHEHRVLDGQTVDVGEPFVVEGEEIRYPGDPAAAPHLVYNCRCRLIGQVKGFERDVKGFDLRNDPDVGGMTYEEWKESRIEKPRRITYQKEVGEAIRGSYYSEYAGDD